MAHIWLTDDEGQWAVLPLEGRELDLAGLRLRSEHAPKPGSRPRVRKPRKSHAPPKKAAGQRRKEKQERGSEVLLFRHSGEPGAPYPWILLSGPKTKVRVNGVSLLWGAHALRDRDEIRVDSEPPAYFSVESLARVETMEEATREIYCPRCSLEITVGSPAVRCPRCGIWHHSSEDYPCWCYASTCALCPHPTALDTGFQWTPADL